jgi:predicted nucleic acid-binding protein
VALIVDASVLYAALDARDRDHERCADLLDTSNELLVIPAPILPEVDYLAARGDAPLAIIQVLHDIEAGAFVVEELSFEDYGRVASLMETHADLDLGFVDAAIVAVVERLDEPKLASLDHRHFSVVRPRHVESLELLP